MMDHEEYLRGRIRGVVNIMKRAGDDAYKSYTKKINSLKSFGKNVDWLFKKLGSINNDKKKD
jgi:hypothetical protein